jgi:hypothetical protein
MLANKPEKQLEIDRRTGCQTKRNKSIPGVHHKITPMYNWKRPQSRADWDAINSAEARQLERGEKRRDNWIKSLWENQCVSYEQSIALGL